MAAVLCAARRLGGALLQLTQAGERRQLVPSRLMRSRDLSSEEGSRCSTSKVSAVLQELKKEEDLVLLLLPEVSNLPKKFKELFEVSSELNFEHLHVASELNFKDMHATSFQASD